MRLLTVLMGGGNSFENYNFFFHFENTFLPSEFIQIIIIGYLKGCEINTIKKFKNVKQMQKL
jgi:hypothetical protein